MTTISLFEKPDKGDAPNPLYLYEYEIKSDVNAVVLIHSLRSDKTTIQGYRELKILGYFPGDPKKKMGG